MKKYLMTGIAALAMCAGMTSCSNHEVEPWTVEEQVENAVSQIQNDYNKKFYDTFGSNVNTDWGFSASHARTRTANPNGNMWEDDGWNVPPVITAEQKEIVRQYFQQNQYPGYKDPKWTNFWIQQVYKGGTNTTKSLSTETYASANGDPVVGGSHMDHLVSVSKAGVEDHVYDFNNSDNNDWEGRMLMENSSTYSFGYINSNATAIHNDKAALVHWTTIRDWANANGLNGEVLNDGLNRSYMGFDFEQVDIEDVYVKENGEYVYAKFNNKPGNAPQYVWDGKNVIDMVDHWENYAPVYKSEYEYITYNGTKIAWVSSNTNQYNGSLSKITDDSWFTIRKRDANNEERECFDLEKLTNTYLSQGYLPVAGSNLKDWVKVCPAADGYYSDWIVTLTEGVQSTVVKANLRVIAEDLSVGDGDEDFDFNDVVFDVYYGAANEAKVKILAAGGTLPLKVAGVEVHELLLGTADMKMINTGAEAKYPGQGVSGVAPKEIVLNVAIENSLDVKNKIKVEVKKTVTLADGTKSEKWIELDAPTNMAASKVAVGTDYQWKNEREYIGDEFKKFVSGEKAYNEWYK